MTNQLQDEIVAAFAQIEVDMARLRELLAKSSRDDTAHEATGPNWIDTGRAMAISKRPPSWLYRNARKFRFGHRLESKSWAFDDRKLRAFLAGKRDQNN